MGQVFSHPAVYWVARVMAMVVMLGGTWLTMLMLARFFRPSHVVRLVMADLPKLEELSGEFGGAKGRIRFNAQAAALRELEDRIDAIEMVLNQLGQVVDGHGDALDDLMREGGNGA